MWLGVRGLFSLLPVLRRPWAVLLWTNERLSDFVSWSTSWLSVSPGPECHWYTQKQPLLSYSQWAGLRHGLTHPIKFTGVLLCCWIVNVQNTRINWTHIVRFCSATRLASCRVQHESGGFSGCHEPDYHKLSMCSCRATVGSPYV